MRVNGGEGMLQVRVRRGQGGTAGRVLSRGAVAVLFKASALKADALLTPPPSLPLPPSPAGEGPKTQVIVAITEKGTVCVRFARALLKHWSLVVVSVCKNSIRCVPVTRSFSLSLPPALHERPPLDLLSRGRRDRRHCRRRSRGRLRPLAAATAAAAANAAATTATTAAAAAAATATADAAAADAAAALRPEPGPPEALRERHGGARNLDLGVLRPGVVAVADPRAVKAAARGRPLAAAARVRRPRRVLRRAVLAAAAQRPRALGDDEEKRGALAARVLAGAPRAGGGGGVLL